jgi:hypothetical protein
VSETYQTLPKTVEDREFSKFELDDDGKVRVRTVTEGTLTGEISPSGLKNGGRITEVTLIANQWTALPPTPLTNRNALGIQNQSGVDIKVNYPPLPDAYIGWIIPPADSKLYDVTDNIVIYGRPSGNDDVIVIAEEIS